MPVTNPSAIDGPFTLSNATSIPFEIQIGSADELLLLLDGVFVSSDAFTVTMNGDGTGTITLDSPRSGTAYVLSDPSFLQLADFERYAPYYPDQIVPPFDLATRRDIRLLYEMSRSLRVPLGEQLGILPGAAARAETFPRFNTEGNAELIGYDLLASLLADRIETIIGSPFKGDPGGNVESIGTFLNAAGGTLDIPAGTQMVRTSGYSTAGDGGEAVFVYSAAQPATTIRFQALDDRWFGISPNQLLYPEMFGGAGSAGSNNSPAILAALALAGSAGVCLRPGKSYGIGDTITIPSNKYFRGAGMGLSTLVLLPAMSTGTVPPTIQFAAGAIGVYVGGFTLNGAHIGHPVGGGGGAAGDRVHGVCPSGIGFLVENIRVHDLWGYGFWATGAGSRGTVRHCWSENNNVLFEATGALHVLFEDCHGLTAPDTITCEAGFHAVPDVTEYVSVNCSYDGAAPSISAVALTANQKMRFINFQGRTTGAYPGITSLGPEENFLYFGGCDIVSEAGNCLNPATGTTVHASDSSFTGWGAGAYFAAGTVGFFEGCHAFTAYTGGDPAYAILSDGVVRWNGGSLDASASPAGVAAGGNVTVSDITLLDPAPASSQTVLQKFSGQFALANTSGSGPYSYFQLIPLPQNISDGTKWVMHLTLIAGGASPTPMYAVMTPKWLGADTVKVDAVSTTDLTGELVGFTFEEWAA